MLFGWSADFDGALATSTGLAGGFDAGADWCASAVLAGGGGGGGATSFDVEGATLLAVSSACCEVSAVFVEETGGETACATVVSED